MKKSVAIIFVVFSLFFEYNAGDDESDLFQSNDLDCWYKPSCNLSQSSNESLIPFVAGCKCDVECLEYKDCCKDSKYFGQSRVHSGKEFSCHPKLEVQMVASCPESYRNTSMGRNCSFEFPVTDVSFVVPVTNKKTRTTYANEYCAGCHGETEYEPWDLVVDFVQITSSFFDNEYSEGSGRVQQPFGPAEDDSSADHDEGTATENAGEEQAAAAPVHVEELLRNVRFQPAHESFLATFRGKTFACAFDSKMPAEMAHSVRRCLPNLISECPDDGRKNALCQSYTQIVYDRFDSSAFRNKDCAECNSILPQDASYCPQAHISTAPARGFVISRRDRFTNRHLCANPILPRYFCPTKSNN